MLRPRFRPFFTFCGLIEWALFPFIGDCHVMADDSGSGFFTFHRESGEWWGLGLHIVADSLRLGTMLPRARRLRALSWAPFWTMTTQKHVVVARIKGLERRWMGDVETSIAAYLTDILDGNDAALLGSALGDIARARGMTEAAATFQSSPMLAIDGYRLVTALHTSLSTVAGDNSGASTTSR